MVSTFVTQSRIASLIASLRVALPRRDRPHLRAQGVHPQHVRLLALDVLRAHVHDARQLEQRARRRGGDAVLAGAGLRDDPGLAEPPREQRLAERVVDLVGAGVGEVLALQVQAKARRARRRRCAACARAPARRPRGGPLGRAGVGRPAKVAEELAQLRPEARVVAERVVGALELLQGRHQRLGHVPAAEARARSPTGRARPHRAGRVRRASGRRRGSGDRARAARARLAKRATRSGSLRGPLAGDAAAPRRRTRRRRRRPRMRRSASATFAGSRPPASDDRDLARDRGDERRVGAAAGPAGMRAAGRCRGGSAAAPAAR